MKKTITLFIIALLLFISLIGCETGYDAKNAVLNSEQTEVSADPDDNPDDTDTALSLSQVIAKSEFDIDKDRETEKCVLTYGPTSGLFTVVFTAYQDGMVKYKNMFNMPHYSNLYFEENEDEIKLVGTNPLYQDEGAEEEVMYYSVSVEENRIVLSDSGGTVGYWGGTDWNLY